MYPSTWWGMTMAFDPTTNRIPFYLLTEDERAVLKAWPHGWTYYLHGNYPDKWVPFVIPLWERKVVYRGKPKPVVTSKWFNVCNVLPSTRSYPTRKEADEFACECRISVMRIDTCNGVSTAHLEDV